jgi:chemotaxis protein MotA
MDILSIAGMVVAIGSILLGNIMEGGHTSSLVQPTAFLIVSGGTIGAVMLQTPLPIFVHALKNSVLVFKPPKMMSDEIIAKVTGWSQVARKEGLLGLEMYIEKETDKLSKTGLQYLVDGMEPEVIRNTLEVELIAFEYFNVQAAKVYDGLGGYAPTVGIIGAVMGLIHVMQNLDDPSKLGSGIAVAFVATIYGVGLANLVFLPFATKLKSVVHNQMIMQEMIIEGIVAISNGENPRSIESKLKSFVH